jgi:acylpyruvate hydrolase
MVGDLRAGYARSLADRGERDAENVAATRIPEQIPALLALGKPGWDAVSEAVSYLEAKLPAAADGLLAKLDDCRLHATVRPSKMIAVGRNYADHLKEVAITLPHSVPSAWIKANSTITGPTRDIVKPACVKELDYETELAIVIGEKCKNVREADAYRVIAGYTVVNDVSARDIVKIERKEGNQLLGKMFDTFAPMGPWLVTKDEIPDPMNLRIITRVNGEIRQNGNTRDMIWAIPKLIAYLSQMTLEPGDVILTGTPDGVAMGRKPGESSWYLQPGDLLESEVEQIGTLRNNIVAATEEVNWSW